MSALKYDIECHCIEKSYCKKDHVKSEKIEHVCGDISTLSNICDLVKQAAQAGQVNYAWVCLREPRV